MNRLRRERTGEIETTRPRPGEVDMELWSQRKNFVRSKAGTKVVGDHSGQSFLPVKIEDSAFEKIKILRKKQSIKILETSTRVTSESGEDMSNFEDDFRW